MELFFLTLIIGALAIGYVGWVFYIARRISDGKLFRIRDESNALLAGMGWIVFMVIVVPTAVGLGLTGG